MAYPILAAQNTWFVGKCSKSPTYFTEITIMDSYIPTGTVESWDASEAQDGSITCYVVGTNLIIAGNGNGKIAMNENSYGLFSPDLTNYGILPIATTTFKNVTKISGLDLFYTANVKIMSFLFSGMYKLNSVDASSWDVSNVEDLRGAFGYSDLKEVNISNWKTPKVLMLDSLFNNIGYIVDKNYTGIENIIGLSDWEVPNSVTSLPAVFYNCKNITSLDLTKWNVENVETFSGTFHGMENLTNLNISNWNNKNGANLNGMFSGCKSLTTINISNLKSGGDYYNMAGSFQNCSKLTKIILPKNFSIGNSANNMFEGCSALRDLDTSDWDTSLCENMSFMFYGCSSLKEIDVSKWDVSKVKNFDHFAAHAGLRRKGIENWDTSSAENMNAMFHNCAEEELDLSGYDTSKVKYFSQMFENSPNLKRIKGLNKWDTSSATGFDEMFGRCPKLEELDLSSWDTRKAKNGEAASSNGHTTGTFRNFCNDCQNLKWIKLGPNFAVNGDGTNTNAEYKLILPTPSSEYIEGADGYWYTINGDFYAPTEMKDKTAETYYASYSMVGDMDVLIKNGDLIDIAKAIREKSGSANRYNPSQFGDAIRAI